MNREGEQVSPESRRHFMIASWRWAIGGALIYGLLISQHAAARSKPVVLLVDRDQFDCLAEKIDAVPKESRGVFVDIRDCRQRGVKILRGLITPPRPVDPSGLETVLFLKPDQVQCIRKNRRTIGRIATAIAGGRYTVKLEPCRR
jgi:hypothetical protein